jgi:hypothetical protein
MDRGELIFCGLQVSDWIGIAEIIATSAIGIWIAITVQNNITKSRYLKEYFISEVEEIRDLYKSFFSQLYSNKRSAPNVKEWFKIMSERILNLDKFVHENYLIDNSLIVSKHAEIQKTITGMDEFNNDYKMPTIQFTALSKIDMIRLHSELSRILIQRVIDINNAKKRKKAGWLIYLNALFQ